MRKSEEFAKFYYKKVGLGEGCGCAERIIDTHEFDRTAGMTRGHKPTIGILGRMRNILAEKLRIGRKDP